MAGVRKLVIEMREEILASLYYLEGCIKISGYCFGRLWWFLNGILTDIERYMCEVSRDLLIFRYHFKL